MDRIRWLVERRKSNHMTQFDVATVANISRAHYTNIEKGSRRPSPETAQKIAAILNFDWKIFYEDGKDR